MTSIPTPITPRTATPMIPDRNAAALCLGQWFSAAYPLGSFAWSQGLEQAVADGAIKGSPGLTAWLASLLDHGTLRSDIILLASAHRGEDVADLALALAPSGARRQEAREQGAAFVRTTNAGWGLDLPEAPLPVAVGQAARALGLPLDLTALFQAQSQLTGLVQAAQRLMPLGQTEAHSLLARIGATLPNRILPLLDLGPEEIGGFAPMMDAASMRHESLEPRLFRS